MSIHKPHHAEPDPTRPCRVCGRALHFARVVCPDCAELLRKFAPEHGRTT